MTTLVTSPFSYCSANGESHNGNSKPVLCTSGRLKGRIYTSMIDAAKDSGVTACSISNVVHGRQKTSSGMTWVLVDEVKYNIGSIAEQLQQSAIDAEDARKWREYQAEQEVIRKAEEKRLAMIEKAKKKVAKLEEKYKLRYDAFMQIIERLDDAKMELECLEAEG